MQQPVWDAAGRLKAMSTMITMYDIITFVSGDHDDDVNISTIASTTVVTTCNW